VLAVSGEPLTLTATLVPAIQGSMVDFMEGESILATRAANADGVATFTTSSLAFAAHQLTAQSSAAHPSAVLTQHMARSFNSLAAFDAATAAEYTAVQDLNSYALGTSFKYSYSAPFPQVLIPGKLSIYSAFSSLTVPAHHLEVADGGGGEKVLYGFSTDPANDPRVGYPLAVGGYSGGSTYYQLSLDSPSTHNALAFDLVGQSPTSTPARIAVLTDFGEVDFGVVTANKFVGVMTTLPLNYLNLYEGCQTAAVPCVNAPIKLDNFKVATPLPVSFAITPTSYVFSLSGTPVAINGTVTNSTNVTQSIIVIQHYIDQGARTVPAGGWQIVPATGPPYGTIPPTTRLALTPDFHAANASGATAAGMAEGPATWRIQLRKQSGGTDTLLQELSIPITLILTR
jgi:hypothetical protein